MRLHVWWFKGLKFVVAAVVVVGLLVVDSRLMLGGEVIDAPQPAPLPSPPHLDPVEPPIPFYIGPSVGLAWDMLRGDPFGELNGASNSEGSFGYRVGIATSFGLKFLPEALQFSVHLSYGIRNGRTTENFPDVPIVIDPSSEPVVMRIVGHQETSLSLISTDLMVGYDIVRAGRSVSFFVTGGGSFHGVINSTATSWEDLVLPEEGRFAGAIPGGRLDSSRRRMYHHENQSIPGLNRWLISAMGGIGARINLSRSRNWLLTPTIFYDAPLQQMTSSSSDFSIQSVVVRIDLGWRI